MKSDKAQIIIWNQWYNAADNRLAWKKLNSSAPLAPGPALWASVLFHWGECSYAHTPGNTPECRASVQRFWTWCQTCCILLVVFPGCHPRPSSPETAVLLGQYMICRPARFLKLRNRPSLQWSVRLLHPCWSLWTAAPKECGRGCLMSLSETQSQRWDAAHNALGFRVAASHLCTHDNPGNPG